MPRGNIRGVVKKGKLKVLDLDGSVIDHLKLPSNIQDTLELLQLKYGKKKSR